MIDLKYPLSAILGHERVKRGLILNIIAPEIGGMVVSGKNGIKKRTVIRSLYSLMQGMEVYTIPLYVTEDKLLGYSERGDTILIGTMNSEKKLSQLQFLDKFGFYVEINEPESQKLIEESMIATYIRHQDLNDSEMFNNKYYEAEKKLYNRILNSIKEYKHIRVPYDIWLMITNLACKESGYGFRRDFVFLAGVKANAAFEGRSSVTEEDVKVVAELALFHKVRDESVYGKRNMKLRDQGKYKNVCI